MTGQSLSLSVVLFSALLISCAACSSGPAAEPRPLDDDGGQEEEADGDGDGDGPSQGDVTEACPDGFHDSLASGAHTGFDSDGETRSFHLLLPEGDAPDDGFPLMVALHGTGERGASFAQRANLSDFTNRGLIVVAPDAVGHGTIWPVWDAMRLPNQTAPNLDLIYFDNLLDCLRAHFDVDESQIFAGGHSAGGIMTNTLLRQRSNVLAGGIPGSSIFEFTGSAPGTQPTAELKVIVTWGGDNDVYEGSTGDGTTIQNFHFAEQSALASQFYETATGVEQYHCEGHNRGHAWLSGLNDWMIDVLTDQDDASEPPDINNLATCSHGAAEFPAPPDTAPECESADQPLCEAVCDHFGGCFLEHGTLGPTLTALTESLGITPASCDSCTTRCEESVAADPGEEAVLECLTSNAGACGPGIKGALPFIETVNTCCAQNPTSDTCQTLCETVSPTDAAATFLAVCLQI